MGDNQHQRIDFVDLTKGVCIILVVMAHIGGAFDQLDKHSMLSCFRMPLYFFISGIFFKPYEGLSGFIIRKTNKLIIPFIFFYVSAFLLKYIMEDCTGNFPSPCIMERITVCLSRARPHQVQSSHLVSACSVQLQYSVLSDSLST